MTSFFIRIRPSVSMELGAASAAEARGDFTTAFGHLQRAHVLGQASTLLHVAIHWQMLRFAIRQHKPGETWGQVWRCIGAAVFTAAGLVPSGNTGGSDVNGFRRMPVAPDLQHLIDAART
jgi:hypothetical protein